MSEQSSPQRPASRIKPGAALAARLRAHLNDAAIALALADSAHAAHKARVSLKRARALARLLRPSHPAWAAQFNGAARAAMAALAHTRDADAMRQAASLCQAGARRKTRIALGAAASALAAERDHLASAAREPCADHLALLSQHMASYPDVSGKQLVRGAHRLIAKAAQAAAKAKDAKSHEARHAWRKAEKARQIAAKEMGALWPGKARLIAAASVGKILGAERDLMLLEERLTHDEHLAGGAGAARRAVRRVRQARGVLAALADQQAIGLYPGTGPPSVKD